MNILLLNPFHGGSHAAWATEYARHSRHRVHLLTLPGRHWKWRMHGGALSLARRFAALDFRPDLLLATDMLDLSGFLALTRRQTAGLPVALYLHENQLTYPWSPEDQDTRLARDRHYAFINYRSCLVADAVFFNSAYHRTAWLEALPDFLRAFPDYQGLDTVPQLAARSEVLPLGLELPPWRGDTAAPAGPPLLLWNHRWEHDKAPEAFFAACYALQAAGLPFRLAVLGQGYGRQPAVFAEARARLAREIVHWGYVPDRVTYWQWLAQADILPVTSVHDFFGRSVVEAIAAGVLPLLPDRLAYPEHLPAAWHDTCLYRSPAELPARLSQWLRGDYPRPGTALREGVEGYDWAQLAPRYDDRLAALREASL